jgi:hypothetical protein
MNLTISLDEPLAARLQQAASARHLTPEQVARELLGCVLDQIADEEAWSQLNRRRGELIAKSRNPGLTEEECADLARVQAAVDQRLEPMDRRLLGAAEQFRRLAEGLPDASRP